MGAGEGTRPYVFAVHLSMNFVYEPRPVYSR